MLKKMLATTALLAIGTGAAAAADAALPYTKAPAASPSYNWSGFYIGGNIGGAASGGAAVDGTNTSTRFGNNTGDGVDLFKSGVTGGVQAGYNWQVTPNWVVGVEGDINALDSKRSVCDIDDCNLSNADLVPFSTRTDYLSTLRGRVGVTWDRSLIYVTGGLAIGRVSNSFNDFLTSTSSNAATRTGYAVGTGIETALWGNWSVKAEYLYANLGNNRVNDNDGDGAFVDFNHEYHIGRVGLNYRFGAPAEASVAAVAPRYTKAPVAVATSYNWSGFYLGGNIGGVASGGAVVDSGGNLDTDNNNSTLGESTDLFKSGFTLGGQAGYNWQVAPNWVFGLEGDISALGTKRSFCDFNNCTGLILTTRPDYLSTIRGRVGYAWNQSLLYVTGGLAIARVVDSFTDVNTNSIPTNAATRTGYAVGAGIETALWSNWSVKAEYLYANLGTDHVSTNPGDTPAAALDFTHEYHLGRIGLNYHFGNPVVAKY